MKKCVYNPRVRILRHNKDVASISLNSFIYSFIHPFADSLL